MIANFLERFKPQNELEREFPEILESCSLKFGRGWYGVIREFLLDYEIIFDEGILTGEWTDLDGPKIYSIEENLGELIISISMVNYEIEKLIDELKEKCLRTCEVCGKYQ